MEKNPKTMLNEIPGEANQGWAYIILIYFSITHLWHRCAFVCAAKWGRIPQGQREDALEHYGALTAQQALSLIYRYVLFTNPSIQASEQQTRQCMDWCAAPGPCYLFVCMQSSTHVCLASSSVYRTVCQHPFFELFFFLASPLRSCLCFGPYVSLLLSQEMLLSGVKVCMTYSPPDPEHTLSH